MRIDRRLAGPSLATALLTTVLVGCGGSESSGSAPSPTPSETTAGAPPADEAPPANEAPPTAVDLAALVEGVPGYTYSANPEAEQAFLTQLGDDPPLGLLVRAIAVDGQPAGNVFLTDNGAAISEQDEVNLLAGAENGAREAGFASSRKEIAGVPAVETVRPDGGKTWSLGYDRFLVIVGARPDVADDFTTKLLERLQG